MVRSIIVLCLLAGHWLLPIVPDSYAANNRCADAFSARIKKYNNVEDAATDLLQAIRAKEVGLHFPPQVKGQSLIPLKMLERLKEHLQEREYNSSRGTTTTTQLQLHKIQSIELTTWHHSQFVIVVNYTDTKYREQKFLGTFGDEFYIWRNYLKAGIQNPIKLEMLDIRNLPDRPVVHSNYKLEMVKSGNFNQGRTLNEYNEDFDGKLVPYLKRLTSDHRWIDMGAGYAEALTQFYKMAKKRKGGMPQLLGLGYKYPSGTAKLNQFLDRLGHPPEFTYIEGKQTLASLAALPKADLITDNMGIYTYHSDPKEVFKRYVGLLNPGGMIFIQSYGHDEIQSYLAKSIELEIIETDYSGTLIVRKIR
jgi:hypothetical protein